MEPENSYGIFELEMYCNVIVLISDFDGVTVRAPIFFNLGSSTELLLDIIS